MQPKYESAVYIYNAGGYKNTLFKSGNDYERVYCGSESCAQKLIFDKAAFKEIAGIKPISFVLPSIITRSHFHKVERLICALGKINKDFELVINDFGMLQWYSLKKRKFPAVMGRVLCQYHLANAYGQKDKTKYLDKNKCAYFIKRYNVNRFEISCLPAKFKYVLPEKVNVSMYFPYAMVTISRNCVFRQDGKAVDKSCANECNGQTLKLGHLAVAEPLVMNSNIYFLDCNIQKAGDVSIPGINRFVQQIF